MTSTISGTAELAGIEFDIIGEFNASWVDNGIGPYECHGVRGVHHDWGWEIEGVDSVIIDNDVRAVVIEHLRMLGVSSNNHTRWIRTVRRWMARVERELAALDPDSIWENDELCEAAGDYEPDVPDRDDWDD